VDSRGSADAAIPGELPLPSRYHRAAVGFQRARQNANCEYSRSLDICFLDHADSRLRGDISVSADFFSLSTLLTAVKWAVFCIVVLFLPPILLGIIRKTKAAMQGRSGASILQPIYDLSKLLRKGETISVVASWIFRSTSAINFAIVLLIAFLTPWITFKPATLFVTSARHSAVATDGSEDASGGVGNANDAGDTGSTSGAGADSAAGGARPLEASNLPVKSVSINGMSIYSQDEEKQDESTTSHDQVKKSDEEQAFFGHVITASDVFLIIYMFALARLFTVLAALDSGSAFGGVGASREVTLALLVEPAIVVALASLGCAAHTSDLNAIFAWNNTDSVIAMPALWFIAGVGLFLASIVELSRMPVDDPTSHIELAMVREAMILENSGRNLALVEYTHLLKMAVLLGLVSLALWILITGRAIFSVFYFSFYWRSLSV
jgi:formate hydrogenlyase subunit 4